MKTSQLASEQNLELAWHRITTGGNYQYKRLYRHIYYAYEVALDANLADLRQRLLGGAFEARNTHHVVSDSTGARSQCAGIAADSRPGKVRMARAWLHKLRRELVCQDRDWLSSTVEVDEVYVGGRDRGARGRSREKRGNRARAKGKAQTAVSTGRCGRSRPPGIHLVWR